jgi:ATP-binding cassette subfamily G (WHITE) protein 2 (PDR)
MPKPKKEKGDKKAVGGHKGAVKAQALDNPSNVGSRASDIGQEKSAEPTRRYASITGAATPPRQEISEKV